jgi:poly(3-hydroxyalkanoate) synthetase
LNFAVTQKVLGKRGESLSDDISVLTAQLSLQQACGKSNCNYSEKRIGRNLEEFVSQLKA